MQYEITYDEQMLIRRRVKVEAGCKDEAVEIIVSGGAYTPTTRPTEVLEVTSGNFDNFKVKEKYAH